MTLKPQRNSIKRIDGAIRKIAVRGRDEEQIDLVNWLLAFQHETEPLRPFSVITVPDRIRTVKTRRVMLVPKGVREVLRTQPLDQARERLDQLHRARVGGVAGTGSVGRLNRRGVRRFHEWWRDVCRRVLNVQSVDRQTVDEMRLPPVTRMLRIHSRAELVDVARWPHTLKLQSVSLLLKFRDRIRICPALKTGGQGPCGRPFVRIRRQQHCSITCAQRERSRRWYRDNRKKT